MVDLRSLIYDQLIVGILKMLQTLDIGYTVHKAIAAAPPAAAAEDVAAKQKAAEEDGKIESKTIIKTEPTSKLQKGELKNSGYEDEDADSDNIAAIEEEPTDPATQGLRPNIPKDFELFLNLVEFCKLILPIKDSGYYNVAHHKKKSRHDDDAAQKGSNITMAPGQYIKKEPSTSDETAAAEGEQRQHQGKDNMDIDEGEVNISKDGSNSKKKEESDDSMFARWVYLLGRELIRYSNEHPLISGFYKLLTITFKNCEKLGYFEGVPMSHSALTESADVGEDEDDDAVVELTPADHNTEMVRCRHYLCNVSTVLHAKQCCVICCLHFFVYAAGCNAVHTEYRCTEQTGLLEVVQEVHIRGSREGAAI